MKKYIKPELTKEVLSIINKIANDASKVDSTFTIGTPTTGPAVEFSDWADWN